MDAEKDLTVLLINNELKCDEHMNKTVSKANSILGLVKRTFKNWADEGFATIYRTCATTARISLAGVVTSNNRKHQQDGKKYKEEQQNWSPHSRHLT